MTMAWAAGIDLLAALAGQYVAALGGQYVAALAVNASR